ncbi:MAG TPA: hypothetical protein PLI66_10150 [Spirochaetales bacterium]|nr:hypothetical protein [Spirochaetales bacterium]HPG86506.1 hypothetical protein [Spirochaetales bacterium]HPM73861.1 hypothetical protein [Spirochaetales bacterium]HQO67086.1 hypothetical protein [Spirochaetales bacterium]
MKTTTRIASALVAALTCLTCLSCDLLGGKAVYLNAQAMEIFHDLIAQSYDIAPKAYVLEDVSETYSGEESDEVKVAGSARLYGDYDYAWDDYYIDANSHKEVRVWAYDGLEFRYAGYKRSSGNVTIVSGSLTIDGTRRMETRYTSTGYTSYSSRTESGSIRVYGTVVVEGVSEGEEVRDELTVDVTRSLSGTSWYYNGTIENRVESWDVYME